MKPAWSVILLTTLTGAAQGLMLALVAVEWSVSRAVELAGDRAFLVQGSALALALGIGGLASSFFHLGRPERAWRAAAMWRTSWLSREVIALPLFLVATAAFALVHATAFGPLRIAGATAMLLAVALFVCTGMVYACLSFIEEWATPLTVINYALMGCASGATIAAALSAFTLPAATSGATLGAAAATAAAMAGRTMALVRNRRLRHRTTVQTALGIAHPHIVQKSQGAMGGTFNTREFFHGRSRMFVRRTREAFVLLAFVVPLVLLAAAGSAPMLVLPLAVVVQSCGLLLERWYFFAEANHPQNHYYRAIS